MGQAIYTAAEHTALKTPFADVMPPLSQEKYEALKLDIEQNGLIKSIREKRAQLKREWRETPIEERYDLGGEG